MRLVQINDNGPGGAKVVAELNQHIEAEEKKGRGGIAGEGQGLSEEDELRIIDDSEDTNSRRSASSVQLSVQTQAHTYRPQQQVQTKGRVCWDRFLPVGTLKVLLVESDDSTRHVVTALLRNCSYEAPRNFSGSEDEILRRAQRLRKKRGGATTSSTEVTPPVGAHSEAETPTKKVKSDDVVVIDHPPPPQIPRVPRPQDPRFPSIPSDFLAHHDVDRGIMPAASQLLFSSARRRLDPCDTEAIAARTVGHLLQGLQNELVVIERMKSFTNAQVRANVRISELQSDVSKVEEEKVELGKRMEELAKASEERETELKAKLAEEQKLKEEAVEECKDVEAELTLFVRAQVSHQYLIQKLPESHFRGYMDAYLQIGSMSDLGPAPSVPADADAGEGTSKKEGEGVVIPVSNGIEAWKYFEDLNNQIDLVLTEVATSGLSCIGLLSKIMSHKSCQNTPVIMMSCHDSMGIVLKCLSKGAADFLVKPIRKNELKNLWQHVWRRCRSSSGSGSESCIRNENPIGAKNGEDSDNDSESNDEDDNRSIDLQARNGSDNGSGTQTSWRKRAAEVESPQQPPVWDQVTDPPDSTCAQATFPMPEAFASSWMPGVTQERDEQDNQPDNVPMGKDLEIGVPRNTESQLKGPNGKTGLANTAEKNQILQLDLNLEDDGRTSDEEHLESNDKSIGQWIKQANKFPGEVVSSDEHNLGSTVSDAPLVLSEKSKNTDKVMQDVEALPSLELSLKRLADVADKSTNVTEQNILRHSQLSAFMRYNTGTTGNQGQAGNVGSCSPSNNSSEAAKQSNSDDTPLNQISNSSSNNNNTASTTNISFTKSTVATDKAPAKSTVNCTHHPSVFQPVQSSHMSKNKFIASGKASAGPVNAAMIQENDKGQQINFQHQHHYHHHNGHCVQQLQKVPAQVDMSKSLDGAAPQCGSSNNGSGQTEVNVANCSLKGSASGSNHGSNCLNGSSAVVNAEGTNMVNDSGMAAKDGADNGSGSGVDQSRSAHREAALNKFRQKRKERCFDKKVRYQSRKQLADQRPRVRGQFVRRDRENKGLQIANTTSEKPVHRSLMPL